MIYILNNQVFEIGELPKSREEALANPIKVIGLDVKETKHNIKKGYLEPFRWILNRPESLEFDYGFNIREPFSSGELVCTAD